MMIAAAFVLSLLFLQLPRIPGSEPLFTSMLCGATHLAFSASLGDKLLFVNGCLVRKILFCDMIKSQLANGFLLEEYCYTDICGLDLLKVGSLTVSKSNSAPEKIPGSPLRALPSSRFSMPPRLTKVRSIHINLDQVVKATHNFSPSMVIREGEFGTVYRAQLEDGQFVAIKRANKEHFERVKSEFISEAELLAKIEHRCLVRLLGYLDEGNERLIMTEYISNGTLREHLDGIHNGILEFKHRLEIVIDVAHGLTYLHLYSEKQIIHQDVNSSNILLTDNMRAKVADFGFATVGIIPDSEKSHVSTKVKGTFGYLDPVYMKTLQLTAKSDVYSFGIVLLETFTGR